MLDLDGVVYVGADAVPGCAASTWRRRGRPGCGSRSSPTTPRGRRPTVAEHLRELGRRGRTPDDVVTSAQAAARVLARAARRGCAGWSCWAAGGLVEAVAAAGLVPVGVEDDAEAVVTGYGPDVPWRHIMRAAVRIRDGLWWVASNTDLTIPTAFGVAPGHGVLVETLRRFTGVEPGGGRQAGPAAARRDRAPLRWRAAADGRRPARHRHRGRARGRRRLAAGDDRA